jgi:hypothetical protein
VQNRIVEVVGAGNYLKVAAQAAGIGNSTLMLWLAKGRQGAAARDAHDPDALYCPQCDHDRTAELAANAAEEERLNADLVEHEASVGIALGPCPQCGTQDHPQQWALDPEQARYVEFLEAVTRAETRAEVAAVTHWRAAFATDWRAARDYLVRRVPDRWAATTRVQISSEEAETRIEQATTEALLAIGIDAEGAALGDDEFGDALLDLDREDGEQP